MAKRQTELQQVVRFFSSTDLAGAEQALETVEAIVDGRRPVKERAKRGTRKAKGATDAAAATV